MKKILFAIFLLAVWALGIYEGDCTVAVGLSLFGGIALMDELLGRRVSNGKQAKRM